MNVTDNNKLFENISKLGELDLKELGLKKALLEKIGRYKEIEGQWVNKGEMKIGSFDIESKIINNIHFPISITYVINNKLEIFSVENFDNLEEDSEDLILNFFWNLLEYKYLCMYAHNFSRFDSHFLLNTLEKYGIKYSSAFWRGTMCSFLKYKCGDLQIHFKDSFLFTNCSLRIMADWVQTYKEACPFYLLQEKKITNV